MEEQRKRRVSKHVTVVRAERANVPVKIVQDEYEEDRLEVGGEIIGWPKPGYPYQTTVERTIVELSDGKKFRLYASEVPYLEKRFETVTKVERKTHRVYVIRSDDGLPRVIVNDIELGLPEREVSYPRVVETVELTFAWHEVTVASHDIPYVAIPHNVRYSRRDGWMIKLFGRRTRTEYWKRTSIAREGVRRTRFASLAKPYWIEGSEGIDFDTASDTKVGDEFVIDVKERTLRSDTGLTPGDWKAGDTYLLEYDYAFWKQEDGSVTNGKIIFPKERPFGAEWRGKYREIGFASQVSAGNWPILLDALVGCYFESVNTDAGVRARVHREKDIRKAAKRIERVVAGQCFDKGTFDISEDVEIGVGSKLLFIGRKNGKKFFAVDSPNHGTALYVFDAEHEAAARDWANGRIDWLEAKQYAKARIIHVGEWKSRMEVAVA